MKIGRAVVVRTKSKARAAYGTSDNRIEVDSQPRSPFGDEIRRLPELLVMELRDSIPRPPSIKEEISNVKNIMHRTIMDRTS